MATSTATILLAQAASSTQDMVTSAYPLMGSLLGVGIALFGAMIILRVTSRGSKKIFG